VILAARPAMGKTALALNAIWHASGVKGLPVAIFSLEMSKEQLVQRLISQVTRIRTQDLRSGNVGAEDWPKLVRGVAEVARAPVWIDDTAGITLMEMRAKVRRLASRLNAQGETPLSLVVVDYLQLMIGQRARAENRQQEISEISRGLKVLARDLNIPVLAIAQLSRAVEQRHDKRPLLSDLRDSGAIEQDADMVMFLYRDEYYNPDSDDKGIAEILVGKHRNGPTGKVQLAWLEQYTKFASLARR
jgi:replicative DNA helicase